MHKLFRGSLGVFLLLGIPAWAQQPSIEEELRTELARLKAEMARIEARLERLEKEPGGTPPALVAEEARPQAAAARQALAMNTPPTLPPSRPEVMRKTPPRFDVLLQIRGDFFSDTARNDTFFLRKAELGVKGQMGKHVDFSLELDPVRPNDPFRRTFVRLSHLKRLHVKLGLEKAPIGLEELMPTAQIPFADRAEVTDRFAAAEELGVHLESRWESWLLQFAVTNGGRRLLRDDNNRKDVTGRVVWAPHHRLSFGAAALHGKVGPTRQERDRYNLEARFGSNLTAFQSEFYRGKDAAIWSSAFYLAGYWAIPTRLEWLTHVQPVARYEHIGRSDRNALQELRLVTFGFSLLFDQNRSKFQVNFLKDLHTGARKDELRAQYLVDF